ncbi:aldo/keto reductase [candidate division KSB1 bacterium]|nr:aldo/keto reductase [candidate division KSB1 bacterium]
MQYRELGKTGWKVSTVSFGAWAIGGTWGAIDDKQSLAALHKAVESGVNFFDTADVYGDGHSEKLLAKLKKETSESIHIATKAGRRLNPHTAAGYNKKNLTAFVERSLKNLETDSLDLVQLHCPPTEVYYMPEVFDAMDELVKNGKIQHYGVSVEKVEEAIKALEFPNVKTVQIIFNMFRLRPADLFFKLAKEKNVGILARVPLASGLLTGKMDKNSQFEKDDHRNFNRNGEDFDKGETFSGVEYDLALKAIKELKIICPKDMNLTQFALRWILMFEEVSCTIPGARKPGHVEDNVKAADLRILTKEEMDGVTAIYERYIKSAVHHLW